jgi:hypothetical protein
MPDLAQSASATETAKSAVEAQLRTYQPPESERTAHFNADLLEYLTAVSLGADPDVLPLHRYLPVEIYFAGDLAEVEGYLFQANTNLIEYDEGFKKLFQIHSVGPSEIGSFRITFVLRSLGRLTLKGVRELLEGIKIACESVLKSLPAQAAEKQAEPHGTTVREPDKEEKAPILVDAETKLADVQTRLAEAQTKLAEAQTKGATEVAKAQAELAKTQVELAIAQTNQAKVTTWLAVAAFIVATFGAVGTGYIQLAHLRAEKPTPTSTITLHMTSASSAFTAPYYKTSPGTGSAGTPET